MARGQRAALCIQSAICAQGCAVPLSRRIPVRSHRGALETLRWHLHWHGWVWELPSETACPQNPGPFSGSLSQWQCFSAFLCVCVCICGGGCYSAVFLESHLSQEYKIRQAKQTWTICFPKDQGFSEALAVSLSYRIYHCKDHKVPWNTCRILGGC